MRDAFGGEFMIRIFLIFILVYILLTALAMNYAKAYKVKELVIAYLEDNEIADIKNMTSEDKTAMEKYIEKYVISELNYAQRINSSCPEGKNCLIFEDIGISIVQIESNNQSNKLGSYYRVTTYFGYDIGFLRRLLESASSSSNTSGESGTIGQWKITGETRLILNEKIN